MPGSVLRAGNESERDSQGLCHHNAVVFRGRFIRYLRPYTHLTKLQPCLLVSESSHRRIFRSRDLDDMGFQQGKNVGTVGQSFLPLSDASE